MMDSPRHRHGSLSAWKVVTYTLVVFAVGVRVGRGQSYKSAVDEAKRVASLHQGYRLAVARTDTFSADSTNSDNIHTTVAPAADSAAATSSSTASSMIKHCDNAALESVKQDFPDGMTIISKTKCPRSDAWLQEFLNSYPSTDDSPFIFLNLGCNKGFDSIRVAKAVTQNEAIFRKDRWHNATQFVARNICRQDRDKDPTTDSSLPKLPIIVHCVEAMPNTAEKLAMAATSTQADKHGLIIHNLALTGTPGGGSILFPNGKAGKEDMGMASCKKRGKKHLCLEVPSITVDEFTSKYIDKGNSNSDKRIAYISIDVEGYDFTVMKAALETLKRTEYLEFEFHNVGDWQKQSLKDATDMLQLEAGFVCYWAGVNRLWRVTDCWLDVYGSFHGWSNVACVAPERAPALAKKMEEVFETTVGS